MALTAKQIVKDQLWVITDGVKKVGNIVASADSSGYSVKIGNNVNFFSTTKHIEQDVHLVFEKPSKSVNTSKIVSFAKWNTNCKTYNDFYDVSRKIHVFTKSKDSKCYYAAGYFVIKINDEQQLINMPKYIFVQRYPYFGPFKTEAEAKATLNMQ